MKKAIKQIIAAIAIVIILYAASVSTPAKSTALPPKEPAGFAAGVGTAKGPQPEAVSEECTETLITENIDTRKIKVFLNEDELDFYRFPITEIDPNASVHDHSLAVEDGVILAPIVLFRLMNAEVYESVVPNGLSRIERVSKGRTITVTLKPGSTYAERTIQNDPYSSILLPAAPKLMNNHLYVPVVSIVDALDSHAEWDANTHALRITDNQSPKYPDLLWALYGFNRCKADYSLAMKVNFSSTSGKDMAKLDYKAQGYYNAGNSFSKADLRTSHKYIIPFNTYRNYEITKVMNTHNTYDCYVRDLKNKTAVKNSIAKVKNAEVLMTDVEYLKNMTEQLLRGFGNSDRLKREANIKFGGIIADKYSIELSSSSIIERAFELKKHPDLDALESVFYGFTRAGDKKSHVFSIFRMEIYIDDEGHMLKDVISYSGYSEIKSGASHSRVKDRKSFDITIEADFYNFGREMNNKGL